MNNIYLSSQLDTFTNYPNIICGVPCCMISHEHDTPIQLNMLHLAIQAIHRQLITEIWDHANCHFPHFPFRCCIEYVLSDAFPGPQTWTWFQPPHHQSTVSLWLQLTVMSQYLMTYFHQRLSILGRGRVSPKPHTHPYHAHAIFFIPDIPMK